MYNKWNNKVSFSTNLVTALLDVVLIVLMKTESQFFSFVFQSSNLYDLIYCHRR